MPTRIDVATASAQREIADTTVRELQTVGGGVDYHESGDNHDEQQPMTTTSPLFREEAQQQEMRYLDRFLNGQNNNDGNDGGHEDGLSGEATLRSRQCQQSKQPCLTRDGYQGSLKSSFARRSSRSLSPMPTKQSRIASILGVYDYRDDDEDQATGSLEGANNNNIMIGVAKTVDRGVVANVGVGVGGGDGDGDGDGDDKLNQFVRNSMRELQDLPTANGNYNSGSNNTTTTNQTPKGHAPKSTPTPASLPNKTLKPAQTPTTRSALKSKITKTNKHHPHKKSNSSFLRKAHKFQISSHKLMCKVTKKVSKNLTRLGKKYSNHIQQLPQQLQHNIKNISGLSKLIRGSVHNVLENLHGFLEDANARNVYGVPYNTNGGRVIVKREGGADHRGVGSDRSDGDAGVSEGVGGSTSAHDSKIDNDASKTFGNDDARIDTNATNSVHSPTTPNQKRYDQKNQYKNHFTSDKTRQTHQPHNQQRHHIVQHNGYRRSSTPRIIPPQHAQCSPPPRAFAFASSWMANGTK